MKNLSLIVLLLTINVSICIAQQVKKDTLNFYVNNEEVPLNDQMITVEKSGSDRQWVIKCPCLRYDANPVFLYLDKTGYTKLVEQEFKTLKLISISDLIKFIKNNQRSERMRFKYVIYFVEKTETGFEKRKGIFIEPREPSNDAVTIKN